MPSDRELASIFWLALGIGLLLLFPGGRASVRQIAAAFLVRSLVVLFSIYVVWIVLLVALARAHGFWNTDLTTDSVIWFLTIGLPTLFSSAEDATKPGYFWRKVRGTLALSVVLDFYLNLVQLPLLVQFVLQPIIVFVALGASLSKSRREFARLQPLFGRLQAIIGLSILASIPVWLVLNVRSLDPRELGLSFLLPIWLTIGVLPLIRVLSIVFSYQAALLRLRWHSENRRSSWKPRLALFLGFRLNLRDLGAPGQAYQWDLAHSKSLREGLAVIREFCRSERQREAGERRRLENLVKFAGVPGTDEEGRQLDRREFVETQRALGWLATCQMGWHLRQGGRYRAQLLNIFEIDSARYGLPLDHGIHLVVSRSGQSWYAWRRAASGWCFAIGAAKAPPDQWLYEGPEPPTGFPGRDRCWGTVPLEQTINWDPD